MLVRTLHKAIRRSSKTFESFELPDFQKDHISRLPLRDLLTTNASDVVRQIESQQVNDPMTPETCSDPS